MSVIYCKVRVNATDDNCNLSQYSSWHMKEVFHKHPGMQLPHKISLACVSCLVVQWCGIKIIILTENFLSLVFSVFDCIPWFTQILITAYLILCQEYSVINHFSIFCLFREMLYGDFANDIYMLMIYCKLHAVCGPELLHNICSWYW
jgi:hypothetical protein